MRTEVKRLGAAAALFTVLPALYYHRNSGPTPKRLIAGSDPDAWADLNLRDSSTAPIAAKARPGPAGGSHEEAALAELRGRLETLRTQSADPGDDGQSNSSTQLRRELKHLKARHARAAHDLVRALAAHGNLGMVWSGDASQDPQAHTLTGRPAPLAFFKTHKSGSTTIGAILFRLAARRGLRIADAGELVLRPAESVAAAVSAAPDLAIGHLTKSGGPFEPPRKLGAPRSADSMSPTRLLDSFYSRLLSNNRPSEYVFMVTVVRHPADRSRSHYDYYLRSTGKHKGGLSKWVADNKVWGPKSKLSNFQAKELGLLTEDSVDVFVAKALAPNRPLDQQSGGFELVMVSERMTDGLLLLRRALRRRGWECDLLDLLHLSQTMSRNWKGQAVVKSTLSSTDREVSDPHPTRFPMLQCKPTRTDRAVHGLTLFPWVQALEGRNSLDLQLWRAATARIDAMIRLEKASDRDGGRLYAVEKSTFAALQRLLAEKCPRNATGDEPWVPLRQSTADPTTWREATRPRILGSLCDWYAFDDST